ncbi:MAG: 2-C-methyl-D-erythritol 2,4-cyclodiphosphate synthase [Mesotoga infera]
MYRTGIGYDVHPIARGNKGLFLGGVRVSDEFYLHGHSDGDVLSHAIVDAILGAVKAGNIGLWFPENERNKGRRSIEFLAEVRTGLMDSWEIVNIDSVVVIEEVRLSELVGEIEESIAQALKVSSEIMSVKPKSGNGSGAGFVQSQAICLLRRVGDINA